MFRYPTTRHTRSQKPPQYTTYQPYKPHLRLEFDRSCVYCRERDSIAPAQVFGVDHYKPVKHFPLERCTYANLYYCCNPCNSCKGSYWPDLHELKTRFVPNPCDHTMSEHFRFKEGEVKPITVAGEFSVELLDLNAPDRVKFRLGVLDVTVALKQTRAGLLKDLKSASKAAKAGRLTPDEAKEAEATLRAQIERLDMQLERYWGVVA